MIGEIPTRHGDVLILKKAAARSLCLVCPVVADGQQGGTADRHDVSSRPRAEAIARGLVVHPAGRIYLKDQDSGEWEQLLN